MNGKRAANAAAGRPSDLVAAGAKGNGKRAHAKMVKPASPAAPSDGWGPVRAARRRSSRAWRNVCWGAAGACIAAVTLQMNLAV